MGTKVFHESGLVGVVTAVDDRFPAIWTVQFNDGAVLQYRQDKLKDEFRLRMMKIDSSCSIEQGHILLHKSNGPAELLDGSYSSPSATPWRIRFLDGKTRVCSTQILEKKFKLQDMQLPPSMANTVARLPRR